MDAPPIVNLFADFSFDVAVYKAPGEGQNVDGQLAIVKFAGPEGMGDDPAKLEAQVGTQMQAQDTGGVKVNVASSETRTIPTADGRPVKWVFAEGTGVRQDGSDAGPFRQVRGTILDGDTIYVLQSVLPEDQYDEAEIEGMLRSIALIDPATQPVPPGNEAVMEDPAADADGDPLDEAAPPGAATEEM